FHMSAYVYTAAGLNLPYYYARSALEDDWEPSGVPDLREGFLTIRNTDNGPIVLSANDLSKGVLEAPSADEME
ncbi:MAG: hypothetical protein ACLQEQ_00210, partial [Nitrososphaerales archaeon]